MSEQDPTPPTPRSPDEHEFSALVSTVQEIDTNSNLEETGENITMGKESPLTDIATSPPPFDLNLNHPDFPSDDSKTDKEDNIKQEYKREYGFGGIRRRKDSYESSELSDLDDNQSEAETDKMDFLDDEHDDGKDVSQGEDDVSDLRTLSKLTELARLKDVDSSDDSERETSIKEETQETGDSERERERECERERESESESERQRQRQRQRKRELENDKQLENNKKPKVVSVEIAIKQNNESNDELNHQSEEKSANDESSNTDEQEEIDSAIPHDDENAEAEDEAGDEAGDEANDAEAEDEDNDNEDSSKNEEIEQEEDAKSTNVDNVAVTNIDPPEESQVDLNEQRKLAMDELISIESRFAELRDKLYQDKLNLLEQELTLCLEGSHPELSKVYYKINGFYQDSLKLANSNLAYKLKCIDKETIATRTSIHQNFLKNLMDTKNKMITDTTSLWYKINKERNQLDQLVPAFNFSAIPETSQVSIPIEYEGSTNITANGSQYNGIYHDETTMPLSKKAAKQNTLVELVHQRNSINEQLGVLNGLIQFHGFPVAINSTLSEQEKNTDSYPEELLLKRATDSEINDDLKAMGISI